MLPPASRSSLARPRLVNDKLFLKGIFGKEAAMIDERVLVDYSTEAGGLIQEIDLAGVSDAR